MSIKYLHKRQARNTIASYIEQASQRSIKVLEAGCGRQWPFTLKNIHLTGVDVDKLALEHRSQQDLDEAIHGDLRSVELPPESFDIIYCAFVLEHVDGAQMVLDNFIRWLKPGGSMILTFPNRNSVFSFFTRITPLWFHVAFKRYVKGKENAGKPGYPPYETFHDKILSPESFLNYAKKTNLSVVVTAHFTRETRLITLFMKVVQILTLNALSAEELSLLYILEKPANNRTE